MSSRLDGERPTGRSLLGASFSERRIAMARSHRLHRPRGGFCARGWCQQCPVEAADRSGLACELPEGAPARRVFDPLRALGLVGERLPPWFYEGRFRRPRALRQTYLRWLRTLSAAPRLPETPAEPNAGPHRDLETDVLVVGGGPSGIAAAATLSRAGAAVVVLTLGAPGGSATLGPTAAGSRDRDLASLRERGALLIANTVCLGLYAEEQLAAAVGRTGSFTVRFERLVVATGAYDRLPLVPGNDLPGVIGLRAFERLAAQDAFDSRSRVGAVGGAIELARARAAAERFGVAIAWAVRLDGDERLERIDGRGGARAARFANGVRRRCDVLVVGLTQPTFELQAHAGRRLVVDGSPPVVRARGDASLPLLEVGEAASDLDPEAAVTSAAANAEAWYASGEIGERVPASDAVHTSPPHPDAFVCLCEDVRVRDVAAAVADGFDDLELVKRRTGATTGPCQGKLCLPLLWEAAAAAGVRGSMPTARPPLRPVSIASLGGSP